MELAGKVRDALQGIHVAQSGQLADLFEGIGSHHGADRDRVVRVEDLLGPEQGKKCVDRFLFGDIDLLHGVGEDEAVHTDHHREGELFREGEGLDVEIGSLLVGGGEQLDPSGVACGHGVAVVVPDIDGCADGPVGQGHDDGEFES